MSLLERTRQIAASTPSRVGAPRDPSRLHLLALAHGALAALASLALVSLPAFAAWLADDKSSTSGGAMASIGADAWLLAHGGSVTIGGASVAFMALLLTAVPLVVATVAGRHLLTGLAERPEATSGRWWRCVAAQELALFVTGYAVTGLITALLARLGPAHPSLLTVLPGVVLLPVVAIGAALGSEHRAGRGGLSVGLVRWLGRVLPPTLSRALRPALMGLLSLLGAGLVMVLAMVALHLGRVGTLYDALGAGVVGVAVLTLIQLAALPNLVVWAVAWMAGPGFTVGDVGMSWTQVDHGALPLVPVLGAVPEPGALPSGLWLVVLVPVLVGALIGWRCVRAVTRLATWRAKAEPAAVAALLVAVAVGVLAWLASGALGSRHLAHVGVSALPVTGAILAEVLVGAIACVTVLHWHQTHRPRSLAGAGR